MSEIKLQVGKTYRSRVGEEVKIVGMGNKGWDYWEGSNGEWYYEGGKWSYVAEEHPKDLIEEVEELSGIRHTFKIPDGAKKVTVSQEGNRIVVEIVPEEKKEPKPGDVMINKYGSVYILKSIVGKVTHRYFALLGKSGSLAIDMSCRSGRPATPEEAQPLWDALKKAGKRWNPETMQVEEIPEVIRIREWVEEHLNDGYYNQKRIAEVIENYLNTRRAKNESTCSIQRRKRQPGEPFMDGKKFGAKNVEAVS